MLSGSPNKDHQNIELMSGTQVQKELPLQAAQNSMYVFRQYHPDATTYHHTVAMKLTGKLDIPVFKQALKILMDRHEALHSEFNSAGKMVIRDFAEPTLKLINTNEFKTTPPVEELQKVLRQLNATDLVNKPFNLHQGPLWRAGLIQYSDKEFQLIFVLDHIIVDVASQNVLLQDLTTIYNSLIQNQTETKLPAKPNLFDIKLKEEKISEKINYWKENLDDLVPITLHTDMPLPKNSSFKGDRIDFAFSQDDIKQITAFLNKMNANLKPDEHKASLHMFFLTSLYILLYRYCGTTDLCVGTASANRRGFNFEEKELNNVINCFVNSIPLRANLSGNPSFIELMQRVKKMAVNAYQNQLPLNEIATNAFKSRTNTATPFDIIFVLNEIKARLRLQDIEASEPIELNLKNSKFQYFGLNLDKREDGSIDGFIEFNAEVFKKESMLRLLKHWKTLLGAIIKNPQTQLADLPILTPEETKQLARFNATEKHPHTNSFVHELVTKQAHETPNKDAAIYHDESGKKVSMTWRQINEMADKIAAHLIHLNIGPGKFVGISMERSIPMIVAMLAIHKTGAAFVPLDTVPGAALDYKILNTELSVVLADAQTQKLFSKFEKSLKVVNVKDAVHHQYHEYKKPRISPTNSSSVYFTSGTTGAPKGVEVKFSGQRNLLNALIDRNIAPNSKLLCVADIKSDALWFDITQWATIKGAELHIVNDPERFSPEVLARIIQQEKINVVVLLPHIMDKLTAWLDRHELPSLKMAITMGAPPDGKMIEAWRKHGIEIRNEWGPTENTVCSTEHVCKPGEPTTSIGVPIRNEKIHIVHPDGTICPIGVPGEIIVEGAGLAKGYYKNPGLTAKSFPRAIYDATIPSLKYLSEEKEVTTLPKQKPKLSYLSIRNRMKSQSNQKTAIKLRSLGAKQPKYASETKIVYRTGDLGHRDPEGNIIFDGRIDNQIKIKGTRIELDAVKQILSAHPNVAEIIVVKHPNKDALVAYVVPKSKESKAPTETLNSTQLLTELNKMLAKSALPPAAKQLLSVMYIDKIHLKSSGKIDVGMLPPPTEPEQKIIPPSTPMETELLKLWKRVLKINNDKDIGVTDSLHILDGNSLDLLGILSIINKPKEKDKPKEFPFELNVRICPNHLIEFYKRTCPDDEPMLLAVTISDLAAILTPFLLNNSYDADPSQFGFDLVTPKASILQNNNNLTLSCAQTDQKPITQLSSISRKSA